MPVYIRRWMDGEWESINPGIAVMPWASSGVVSGLGQTIADGLNNTVFDEDRIRLPQRALQLARNQRADVFDQDRRH